MKIGDIFFGLVAMAAAACFIALVSLQVMEWKYYEEPESVWPKVAGKYVH